jgi:hypothetical protein
MAPETADWPIPAPVRALLWWPPVAFVLAMIDPDGAPAAIVAAGVLLMAAGAVVAAVAGRRKSVQPAGPQVARKG